MDPRPDITDKLVHFTSGATEEEAFKRLQKIITERRLVGSSAKILGNYNCVCFSEAPLTSLQHGLVNPSAYSCYSPFGILVEKRWIFEQGGRPVIYQPNAEFELLPEPIRWRHMRYEPGVVDLTWESEWRIKCDELRLEPNLAGIVVPVKKWAEAFLAEHDEEQDFEVYRYSQIMDELLAEQYRENFSWRIYVLN
jgi:hypothetical protein